jgi:hypothetical protein
MNVDILYFISTFFLDQINARTKALIKCQILHQAAINAIPPCPSKKLKIRISARPEF